MEQRQRLEKAGAHNWAAAGDCGGEDNVCFLSMEVMCVFLAIFASLNYIYITLNYNSYTSYNINNICNVCISYAINHVIVLPHTCTTLLNVFKIFYQ